MLAAVRFSRALVFARAYRAGTAPVSAARRAERRLPLPEREKVRHQAVNVRGGHLAPPSTQTITDCVSPSKASCWNR